MQLNWARSEIPRGSQGEREATYTENFDFNAAHLIADHFLGSGYRDSLNIVTTSTHYNQVVMQEVERKISEWIRSYRTDATSLRSVTFDMQVRATWGPPVLDDGILDQIRTQILSRLPANSPERQQFVADFAQTHRQIVAVGSAINRILSVEYHVQVHVDGVPKDAPREFRIGPDIYLGMDNEVLRRLFPRS